MPAQDFIGLTGPDYEMDIERGKIRSFARAMNAPIPDFVEGENPVIPATFLVTAGYSWGYTLERPRGTVLEQVDHDLSIPLHAEEAYVFHGPPPRAGDRLTCRTSLEDVRTKSGAKGGELTFLTMLTEFRNHSGNLVAEQRATTVTTGQSPEEGDWNVSVPDYEPHYDLDLDPGDPFEHIKRAAWAGLVEGAGPGKVDTGPLTLLDMVRFQGVEGEDNPLHYDKDWAAANGYPGLFGLGMHQASVLVSYAAHWLDPAAVRSFKARFRNVYWCGDPLSYDGTVARMYMGEETGHNMVDLALSCTRNGDPIVDVWMTLDLGAT